MALVQHTPQVLLGSQAEDSSRRRSADRRRLPGSKPKGLATVSALCRGIRRINSKTKNPAASGIILKLTLLSVICCILLGGCRSRQPDAAPSIEFTRVPLADEGGPASKVDTIAGRVVGAHPDHQVVLFAHSGGWYVQPLADEPFTTIQPDMKWRNSTRLGTEYAALLVEPGYRPPALIDVLPGEGEGVVAVAVVKGEPAFWQTWWFRLSCALACLFAMLAFYRFRLHQLTSQLNLRFEERLSERTRIAQELHDTLLQGFISASMQLHVAVDNLPADSPAKPLLSRVQQLMGQVIEEGRNAIQEQIGFRVIVEGRPRPLHPMIRDEVYRIGREALVNAFRHSQAKRIEVELEYAAKHLRILVRDDGCGIDSKVLRSGRDRHWGLSGMRERAERIGGRLNVWSRTTAGTEVELSVPNHIAFQIEPSGRGAKWFARLYRRRRGARAIESKKGQDK